MRTEADNMWMFWRRARTVAPLSTVRAHEAKVDRALAKANADAPQVEQLATEIRNRVEENQWSPKIHAGLGVPPRRRRKT